MDTAARHLLPVMLLAAVLTSCGGRQASTNAIEPLAVSIQQPGINASGFPMGLPVDGVQPWEELDAAGHVLPHDKSASSINSDTDFTPGVERFSDAGDAVDNLEATRLNGTDDSGTSYAMYRVSMGSEQPGIVSVDANLLGGSGYYVGLSNYDSGRWDWHGPFTDNHVRLQAVTDTSGDLTSALGNTFVSVLVPSGSSLDVIGIGVNQYDIADATAPSTPVGIGVLPVPGGLELYWSPVLDNDLGGYVIFHSDRSFINPDSAGVQRVGYLEGSVRHLISELAGRTYIRVATVDFAGNESPASMLLSADPLPADPIELQLSSDEPSGGINDAIMLSASGASSYDWDLDGDGVYEIQNDSSGLQAADTSSTGIIRPRVQGRDSSGEYVALGGLSLIITGNTRPVASAQATPSSGKVDLDVDFSAVAEDSEDDASLLEYAWDLNGDGIYEPGFDTLVIGPVRYAIAGTYNVKFRVTDSDGAWDVDTIAINAIANQATVAGLAVSGGNRQPAPFLAEFDVSGCFDPDGSIASYSWDWENDGTFDLTSGSAVDVTHMYADIGEHEVQLRITDDNGSSTTTVLSLVAQGWKTAPVNNGDDVGMNCSLAVVDGHPAISYFDDTNGALKYARSNTPTGENSGDWQDIITVDATAGSGSVGTSLLVVQGTPAIAYHRGGGLSDLMYVRSSTNTGTQLIDWSTPVLVQSTGFTGYYPDMEIVADNPAICYYDNSLPGLRIVRSNSLKGELAAEWGTAINVDISGDVGQNPSMAIVDGNPAISYSDLDNDRLLYARSTSRFGTLAVHWSQKVILTGGGFTGYYSSLAVINGKPAICYSDLVNESLMYTSSKTADGALPNDWLLGITIDNVNNPGMFCSMLEYNSRPAISSYGEANTSLRFIEPSGSGSAPSDWGSGTTIEETGIIGEYSSIAEVQGKVAIAYYQSTGGNLRYAIRYQ